MKFFLEIVLFAAIYLIFYRRIIEPFMEGFRQKKKVYNENPSAKSTNIGKEKINDQLANQEIIDAEFEEIQ